MNKITCMCLGASCMERSVAFYRDKLGFRTDGMEEYLRNVNRNLEEYNHGDSLCPLSISYGKGFCEDGDVDTFIRVMDAGMYEMKARHHQALDACRANGQ